MVATESNVTIRPATREDADAAADLIYLPMGRLADHLFGNDDPARAREVLRQLYQTEDSRFSYRFCEIVDVDGSAAGLLLSYSAKTLSELAIPTGKHFRQILGTKGMLQMIRRSLPFMRHKECHDDEYYVFTIAVKPEFQSRGLGKIIIERAKELAQANNLQKISLGVTLNNYDAIKFYSRLGFNVVETVPTPKLEKKISHPGYCKMLKEGL